MSTKKQPLQAEDTESIIKQPLQPKGVVSTKKQPLQAEDTESIIKQPLQAKVLT